MTGLSLRAFRPEHQTDNIQRKRVVVSRMELRQGECVHYSGKRNRDHANLWGLFRLR